MPDPEQFLDPHPHARRTAVIVCIVAALFAGLLVYLIETLQGSLGIWLEQNIEWLVAHPEVVFFSSLLLVSPLLFGSMDLFRYGTRVLSSELFPAPGYAVIRRVRIEKGSKARLYGKLIIASSGFILSGSIMVPVFLTGIFVLLGNME